MTALRVCLALQKRLTKKPHFIPLTGKKMAAVENWPYGTQALVKLHHQSLEAIRGNTIRFARGEERVLVLVAIEKNPHFLTDIVEDMREALIAISMAMSAAGYQVTLTA